jgi:hypothetical protein
MKKRGSWYPEKSRRSRSFRKFPLTSWLSTIILLIGLFVAFRSVGFFSEHYSAWREQSAFTEVNNQRIRYGRTVLTFDKRVYAVAKARAVEMVEQTYYDHTNPVTGNCASKMKAAYGLQETEYVAENVSGYPEPTQNYMSVDAVQSVDGWMHSRGHRYNLLFPKHTRGAVACHFSKCVFLGLNHEKFGQGCYTAAEGMAAWKTKPLKPDEVEVPPSIPGFR